ncbi:hypothetical protein ILP92_00705 [Maribius pontilimi]|uniref:Uncharacterized protein n=1 Tax=Palleronia pontilimi TaxID=1964209 RepID=A0A934I8Z0_9RHOB|nr:hypothetical protein [Palleronia pontilimi]MBJ3761271.1 hypothetical protein [Palleronia pontilimi]
MPRTPARLSPVTVLCWAQAVILAFVSVDLLRSQQGKWLLREGGGIESVSAVLLAGAALLYLTYTPSRQTWHVPVGLILLAMRELDFDKRFTSEGVLQLRLYSGDAPMAEKLVGAAIVLLALVVLARLALFQAMPWLRALLRGAAWAWLFALSAALIVIAKSLDGIARKLAPLGIDVPADLSDLSSRVEELFELFFALALLASLTLVLRTRDAA